MIFLDNKEINKYYNCVNELLSVIANTFNLQYQNKLHSLIANNYFNSTPEMISNSNWVSIKRLIYEAQLSEKKD